MNMQTDAERGAECEFCGKKAKDMSREELIAFVGLIDREIERLHAVIKGES